MATKCGWPGWRFGMTGDVLHVWPTSDLEPHELGADGPREGAVCVCGASVALGPSGVLEALHNAHDGRECWEMAQRLKDELERSGLTDGAP